MTLCASDGAEPPFSCIYRGLYVPVPRDYTPRNCERCLKESHSRNIGARQFIDKAVAVGIGSHTEALGRLHSGMMVEGVVTEFPKRDHSPSLVKGPNHEIRHGVGPR